MIKYQDVLILDRKACIVDYTDAIEKVFPSYKSENKASRDAMNVVLSIAYPVKREEYYLILHDYIILAGVTYSKAMSMLKKYPVFVDSGIDPSKFYQRARRWLITKEGLEIYKNEITGINVYYRAQGKSRGKLVSEEKIPRSIRGKTVADYTHSATISVKELEDHFTKNEADMTTRDQAELYRVLELAKYRNGELDQEYFRKKTGRLYAYGSGAMQTMPKPMRKAAFKGCYDIDLCNAHYRIASHFTENKIIQEYAYDASLVRKMLANDLNLSPSDVKLLFIMLMYGAGTSGRKGSSLEREFGKDKLQEMLSHNYTKSIMHGIEQLTEDLQVNGYVTIGEGETASQSRAAFMQSYEAQILDVCIDKVKPELLLFDGFITKENVSCEWLQEIILDNTGLDIEVSKEIIGE